MIDVYSELIESTIQLSSPVPSKNLSAQLSRQPQQRFVFQSLQPQLADAAGIIASRTQSLSPCGRQILIHNDSLTDPREPRLLCQKRGTFVRERKYWNLLDADVIRWRVEGGAGEELMRDLADVRSIVEPAAAHRAALHRTEADLEALEAALGLMGRARADSAVAAEADAAFHRALLAATGNEMLARMDMLLEPGLRERGRLVHAHASVGDPVPSHRAVLDAVRDRDPARAELAMLDLLAKAVEDLDHVTGRTADPADRESPHGAR